MSSRRIFNDTGTRRYAASGSIATQPLPGSTASGCATCQRASAPLRALWSSRSAQTAFLHSRTRSAHWSHGLRSTPSMGRWGRDRTCGRRQRSGTPLVLFSSTTNCSAAGWTARTRARSATRHGRRIKPIARCTSQTSLAGGPRGSTSRRTELRDVTPQVDASSTSSK